MSKEETQNILDIAFMLIEYMSPKEGHQELGLQQQRSYSPIKRPSTSLTWLSLMMKSLGRTGPIFMFTRQTLEIG